MKQEIKDTILEVVNKNDYNKGLKYDQDSTLLTIKNNSGFGEEYIFRVIPKNSYFYRLTNIVIQGKKVKSVNCNCYDFFDRDSCEHVAACLINHSEALFAKLFETEEEKSKRIMESVKSQLTGQTTTRKEEVFLIPSLNMVHDSYRDRSYVFLRVRIGIDRKYLLGNKTNNFIRAYENEEEYKFGKNFTYDPKSHYFSENSKRLIEFIKRTDPYNREIYLNTRNLDELFSICENKIHIEGLNDILPVKDEFPFKTTLTKNANKYILNIEIDSRNTVVLNDEPKYVYLKKAIYRLNKAQQRLLEACLIEEIDTLTFDENEFNNFKESLIPVIKDKIETDESTKDIIIVSKPKVKLYFDILEDSITCDPKFIYDSMEVSFFEKNTQNVIRDTDYERNIEDLLYRHKFEKGKKSFVLIDLDDMCELLERGLDDIAQEHEVYTSEKLKNTNIIKNNTVSSTFSIGKDNILRYTFDLGEIDAGELNNIMKSIDNNKKYYRLKSGDIISLEEESIKELHDLSEDLELEDYNEINGVIPKYRAIYLDYLKENKYGIIKTDSLFQKFIDQFNEYKDNNLVFTKKEKDILRDYQEEGVKWLYTIKKCGFGGILADEMGLGKSIQTIYLIKKLIEENKDSKYLIICPTSLVYNWENEFKKFAPELNFQVFAGLRANRIKSLQEYKGNIYITTYGLLREDLEHYDKMAFEVCVIDEAQNIKNPKTGLTKAVKKVDAVTKLALTGTPIENSIVELWSIFDYIMPGFLSNLMNFQKKYHIKDVEGDNNVIDNLKKQVKPFILRRKKKDVIKDLPDKIENNIYIDLSEEQKKIYASEVTYVQEEMAKIIKNGNFQKERFLILKLLTRLRQVCISPSILYKDYKYGSSKIESLLKIIKEVSENGHKTLLFTSFKTALDIVKKELDKESISNYTIAGDVSSKTRQQLVDAFNKDNTKVFLIMLKSGGTGLNLTSADVVIHLDLWWNPQVENQATDRAHRIGQKNTVEVIKLICKGTIEEKILELQNKKRILSEKILEKDMDDSKYLNQLSEDDIKNLITYNNEE